MPPLDLAGLRRGLASLDANDIALSARKGKVTVRAGKGDLYRASCRV
jgi:hypothetical protein